MHTRTVFVFGVQANVQRLELCVSKKLDGALTWLKDNAGWIAAAGLVVSICSATFSGCTLYFNFLSGPRITAIVGNKALLNQKPYIGLDVTVRNSGATQGVITSGNLLFNNTTLNLVMRSLEPPAWSYESDAPHSPMKFTFFSPIVLGKDESQSSALWFEVDTGGARLFTNSQHRLTLNLMNEADATVATARFSMRLSADDIANIYANDRGLVTLPVDIAYDR